VSLLGARGAPRDAALQQFELEATDRFAPFTSKDDAYLLGKAAVSASEQRGLEPLRHIEGPFSPQSD